MVLQGSLRPGALVGTQRKAGLSWVKRSRDLLGVSALYRGPSSPGATRPSGGQLTGQDPGDVINFQSRRSEMDWREQVVGTWLFT